MTWDREETVVLGEVRDDLEERLDANAETMATEEPDEDEEPSEAFQDAASESGQLNRHLVGVAWAVDEFGEDAEVAFEAVDTGTRAEVRDYNNDLRSTTVGGPSSTDGVGEIYYTAGGIASAPFVDEGAGIEATVAALSSLPSHFADWLNHRVNETSTPEVDIPNFGERLEAKREQANTSSSG